MWYMSRFILEEKLQSCHIQPLCSCQTRASESNITNIELQEVNPQKLKIDLNSTSSSSSWCSVLWSSVLLIFSFTLQVVGRGCFATVFQGRYKNSVVAVKVYSAGWKHKFATEKEIYELPLMEHSGIVQFLGAGWKPDDDSWIIVLQYAEFVRDIFVMMLTLGQNVLTLS